MKLQVLVLFILSGLISIDAGIFECDKNSCAATEAKCENNLCVCPPKKIHNLQGTKCLELAYGFEESCEDDNQCAILGGSYKCDPNVRKCVCAKGWVYIKGKCIERLKIGDPCVDHYDCFDGMKMFARICEDKKCICNVGYYSRQNYDCREIRKPGESCLIDTDCEGTTCINGFCGKTGYNQNHLIEDDDIITPRFAEDCVNSDSCKGKHMHCSPFFGKCLCKKGYFLTENGKDCDTELGMRCEQYEDCKGIGKRCVVTCDCTDLYFHKPGNRKCTRGPFNPSFYCADNSSCVIFGENAHCKDMGVEKKCACLKDYKLNENFLCERSEGGGSVKCKVDEDCDIKNSICASTGSCVCDDNTIYDSREEVCYSKLGGVCKIDYDCKKVEGAICGGDGKCVCMKNYVAKDELECLKVSSGLGDRCNEDLECSGAISNSVCLKNHTCVCQEGYIEIRKACLPFAKKLGDYCSHLSMCSNLDGEIVCRKNSCQCDEYGCDSSGDSPYYNLFVLILCLILVLL